MPNSTSIILAMPELQSNVRNVHDVVDVAEICWLNGQFKLSDPQDWSLRRANVFM